MFGRKRVSVYLSDKTIKLKTKNKKSKVFYTDKTDAKYFLSDLESFLIAYLGKKAHKKYKLDIIFNNLIFFKQLKVTLPSHLSKRETKKALKHELNDKLDGKLNEYYYHKLDMFNFDITNKVFYVELTNKNFVRELTKKFKVKYANSFVNGFSNKRKGIFLFEDEISTLVYYKEDKLAEFKKFNSTYFERTLKSLEVDLDIDIKEYNVVVEDEKEINDYELDYKRNNYHWYAFDKKKIFARLNDLFPKITLGSVLNFFITLSLGVLFSILITIGATEYLLDYIYSDLDDLSNKIKEKKIEIMKEIKQNELVIEESNLVNISEFNNNTTQKITKENVVFQIIENNIIEGVSLVSIKDTEENYKEITFETFDYKKVGVVSNNFKKVFGTNFVLEQIDKIKEIKIIEESEVEIEKIIFKIILTTSVNDYVE